MVIDKIKKAIIKYVVNDEDCMEVLTRAIKANISYINDKVGNNNAIDILGYIAQFVYTHHNPIIIFAYDQAICSQGYTPTTRNTFIQDILDGAVTNDIITRDQIKLIAVHPSIAAIDGYSNKDILLLVDCKETADTIAKIYGAKNYKYIAINECTCNYKTVSFWGRMEG